ILTTIILSRRHTRGAAFLLMPYLLWVSFAAVLNYGFWSLN
ncbi:MAG: tryptophan-rich sensory protein, partial [Fuerstia sp.]|nr:tryptophan-rich sensory protein [Fuerstiella sp.]